MTVKALFAALAVAAVAGGFALPHPQAAEAQEPRPQVQMLELG